MQTKRTIQGEAWDILAKSKYGSEYEMHTLLAENPACLDTLLFSGNIPVNVPENPRHMGMMIVKIFRHASRV